MGFLSRDEKAELRPAETALPRTPIPTAMVSSDEYMPRLQTGRQKELQSRLLDAAGDLAAKQGLSRRRFFQTSAGMAAAFVALNDVYGPMFEASAAEAATPE